MKKNREILFPLGDEMRLRLRKMKLTVLLTFLVLVSFGKGFTQVKLSLYFNKANIHDVLASIEKKTDYIFMYKDNILNDSKEISVDFQDVKFDEVLKSVCEQTNVDYDVRDRQIILKEKADVKMSTDVPQPRQVDVSGTILDVNGLPIPGATISIKGTLLGITTDNDGKFKLSLPADTKVLVFSFVGMKTQEVVLNGKTKFNIVLSEQAVQLSEIVTTGYGVTTTREKLTGSISAVQGKKLADRTTTSPLMLLAGLATGVRVSSSTSLPGVLPVIRVREVSSWKAGAGVLYVIDGVVADIDAFQALNPNDIASVSVLKDAASAAIYGMKAGEGVLLVTTKTGTSGKTRIEYGYSYSLSTPYILFHQLNAYNYALSENKWNKLVGRLPGDSRYFMPNEIEYFKTHSYDALSNFWSNPRLKNHNISVTGGNERVKYFVSGSYNKSEQPSFSVNYEKYTVRAKIDAKMTDRLTFSLNLNAEWDKNTRPNFNSDQGGDVFQNNMGPSGNSSGVFSQLLMRDPTRPYFNIIDGVKYPLDVIVAQLVLGQGGTQTYNNTFFNPIATMKYTIPGIQGLTASVQYSYNNKYSKNKLWSVSPYTYNFISDRHIITDNFNYAAASGWKTRALMTNQTTAGLSQTYGSDMGYQGNYQFSYARSFGLHNVSGIAGYEFRGRKSDYISATRYGYALESYNQISGGSSDILNQRTAGDITINEGMASWIGRVDYDFSGKYLLGFTIRRDGSYKFSPDKRWGTFPAVSASWVASKESFFEPLKSVLSFFKLRASWGITGTDNTNPFQWQDSFAGGTNYTEGAEILPTLKTSVVPNPFITWEKNNNLNVGVDFGMLNNVLTFSAEGWYKRTTDILGARVASTPGVVGASLPDVNYGIASAQGVEFTANYQQKIGEISLSLTGNIAHSVNKVILRDVAAGTRDYDNPNGHPMNRLRVRELLINGTGAGVVRTQIESSTLAAENAVGATPYTTGSEKVQLEPGMLYLRDFRGSNGTLFANSPDGNSNHNGTDDMIFIPDKYTSPRLVYGLNANIAWRNIELSMLAAGTGGYWASQVRGLTSLFERVSDFWPDEWTPASINTGHPSPIYSIHANWAGGRIDYPNTYTTYNMSFLRMKNMSLSYKVPAKILSKAGLQGLKFYMNVENAFMIFKKCPDYMDPESIDAAGYPILRVYSVGVNFTL